MEQTYGINFVFLAGLAGSEGGWDEANPTLMKSNNLFGYSGVGSNGSYFNGYINLKKFFTKEESIRDTAKNLSNNYLKPGGKYYKETETGEFDYFNFIKNYVYGNDTLSDSDVFSSWKLKTGCIATVINYIPEY